MGLPGAMDPWDGTTYDPTRDSVSGEDGEMSVEEWRKEINRRHMEQMSWAQRFFWNEDFEQEIANDAELDDSVRQRLAEKCTEEYDDLAHCVQQEGYNSCRIRRRKYLVCLIDKREQYLEAKGQLTWFRRWTIERERRRGDTGLSDVSDTENKLFEDVSGSGGGDTRRADFIDPELVDIDKIMQEEYGSYSNKKQ